MNPTTLTLSFTDRDPAALDTINSLLAALKLSRLKIDDIQGHLATETTFDRDNRPISLLHRYGIDSVQFTCAKVPGETGYIFQIAAEFREGSKKITADDFHDQWSAAHPDLVIRSLLCISYREGLVFLFLYHRRIALLSQSV